MLQFSLCTCRRHYPGEAAGCLSFSSPAVAAFPVAPPGQPSHRCFRGLLNVHSHYSPHTRGVALTTLSIGGFRPVVAFPPAPTATGRNDPCREGLAPSQEPCLSTAHGARTTQLLRPQHRRSSRTPRSLTSLARPAITSRTRQRRVHRIPPRVRDDRDTPLGVGRDDRIKTQIYEKRKQNISRNRAGQKIARPSDLPVRQRSADLMTHHPTPPSLRAQRSNPDFLSGKHWIASLRSQ